MTQEEKGFCFCTLALGKIYRALASLLAEDLEKYAPDTSFIVLTDNPLDFSKYSNVIAFKHRQQSVKCYHEKRFVIAKALSLFNSCIFIDADMRILAPLPQDLKWVIEPGIAARACDSMGKKYAKVITGVAKPKACREFKVTQAMAQKLNLDLRDNSLKFVYEYLFSVTKDCGKEIDFLKHWEIIAPYFELNGVYDGEGNAIGLAAAKAGLKVRWSDMEGIEFFKDRTELVRIQKGQSNINEMSIYFEQQKMLEQPKRSVLEKVVVKISRNISDSYHLARLIIKTLRKFNFYYR